MAVRLPFVGWVERAASRRWVGHYAMAAIFAWALCCLALAGFAAPAVAAVPTDVDLQLVLAVDVSRSMDADEQRLQRDGYVAAFRHQDVIDAITANPIGKIAVTYVEWSGPELQTVVVPWTVIASRSDAEAFAAELAAAPIGHGSRTSISGALTFGASLLAGSTFRSEREAIDVSGDGPNNAGVPVDATRDAVVGRGITINGLPIMVKAGMGFGRIANLDAYYQNCVVGGPGAFMLTINDTSQFETAIRRKIVLEIAGMPAKAIPVADVAGASPVDCQIGEKTQGNWNLYLH